MSGIVSFWNDHQSSVVIMVVFIVGIIFWMFLRLRKPTKTKDGDSEGGDGDKDGATKPTPRESKPSRDERSRSKGGWEKFFSAMWEVVCLLVVIGLIGWCFKYFVDSDGQSARRQLEQIRVEANKKWVMTQVVKNPLWLRTIPIAEFHDNDAEMEMRVVYQKGEEMVVSHYKWDKRQASGTWSQPDDHGTFQLIRKSAVFYYGSRTSTMLPEGVVIPMTVERR